MHGDCGFECGVQHSPIKAPRLKGVNFWTTMEFVGLLPSKTCKDSELNLLPSHHMHVYLVWYECIELFSLHSGFNQLISGLSTCLASHQSLCLGQEVGQQNLHVNGDITCCSPRISLYNCTIWRSMDGPHDEDLQLEDFESPLVQWSHRELL